MFDELCYLNNTTCYILMKQTFDSLHKKARQRVVTWAPFYHKGHRFGFGDTHCKGKTAVTSSYFYKYNSYADKTTSL